jgi:hypothetical protein
MQHFFGCRTDIVCVDIPTWKVSSAMAMSGSSIMVALPIRITLQAQPGTVGVLRLEEVNRANVTIYDLKTLLPTLALQLREGTRPPRP